ncbi:MAG: (Fe-S)-binding protein [Firmicutes bacterium]|jgi:Fe-S oxidoreductase|nr:(Fe-S)-binding protein [Bacillota bacterium]
MSRDELLDRLMPCMKCGLCRASCPIFTEVGVETSVARGKVRLIKGLLRGEFSPDDDIASRIYLCLLCKQCTTTCPSGVEVDDIIAGGREYLVSQGYAPEPMRILSAALTEARNITGEPRANRTLWMDDLETRPRQVEPGHTAGVDIIYYTGCVAALFPTVWAIPQSLVQLFRRAGLNFAVLGGEEWCCGYPMMGGGITAELKDFVSHNVGAIEETGARTLVTGCPSCYHAWKYDYPRIVGRDLPFEVVHSSQLLEGLIQQRALALGPVDSTVTYHDPCDLGRKSGVFDAPRNIIRSIPELQFLEMAKSRDNAICCGGGGNLEMLFPDTTEAVASRKISQIREVGASTVVSSCQQCKRTIAAAVRREKARVRVLDIAELLLKSVQAAE